MEESPYGSHFEAEARRLVVSGAVDELSESRFRGDLAAVIGTGAADQQTAGDEHADRVPVIDLSAVEYFPSIAVSALVAALKAQKEREGVMAEVEAVTGTVAQRVLALCGIPHRAT